MKKLFLAAALLGGGLVALQGSSHAHGGQYRGPGDTVPPGGGGGGGGGGAGPATGPAGPTSPGGAGPSTPGAGAPGAPGAGGGKPVTGGGGDSGPDLTQWTFWWEFNKEPYLNLKSKVQSGATETGTDGFFLGHGAKAQTKDNLKPTQEQVRQKIVPALLQALEKETNNDIVTGCLIALAKIGDAPSETGESQFEQVIRKFLSDKNQEISETAAVALGILANPKSIPTLTLLLTDHPDGRKLVGAQEVNYRTRAFAAYGLGLIGKLASNEADRQKIVEVLRKAIETDNTRSRDLRVSCVISLGLVPLETIEAAAEPEKKGGLVPPETSRIAQLDYLLAFLQNDDNNYLVRAHCPTALARLLVGLPPEQHKIYRERIASDLLERIDSKKKEQAEVVQSAVLALGLIGTNDKADALDKRIVEALVAVPKDVSDQQARNFSLIALAKIAGTTATGAKDPEGGTGDITKALLSQLADGKSSTKPWAGLACGVMADKLVKAGNSSSQIPTLQGAVRAAFKDEKDPSRVGAFAISSGIMNDVENKAEMMKRLDSEREEAARGYVAVGLGLMNAREAVEKINKIVDESKYRPDLLKQAAIALGLLGDKDLVPKLIDLLQESKGLATQASLSSALGFIGDQRSIDPLVTMLQNDTLTERARGFAAVALGIVADKELLPWNSKIGLDLNYRAATETLTNQASGTGILDIL
ncbi:MAG TPA: HEAT repeat domain-containing protein [Planctomycetota bacterium]